MQCLIHFGVIHKFATGLEQPLLRNRAVTDHLRLLTQIKATQDLAMADYFASTAAVRAQSRFCSLAIRTHALAIATGTIHLTIDTIGTRNCLAFTCWVCIDWIGNWHTLLSNPLKHVRNLLGHRGRDILCLFLEKWPLLTLCPICNI